MHAATLRCGRCTRGLAMPPHVPWAKTKIREYQAETGTWRGVVRCAVEWMQNGGVSCSARRRMRARHDRRIPVRGWGLCTRWLMWLCG